MTNQTKLRFSVFNHSVIFSHFCSLWQICTVLANKYYYHRKIHLQNGVLFSNRLSDMSVMMIVAIVGISEHTTRFVHIATHFDLF